MAKKNDQRERPKGTQDIGPRSIEGVEASDLPDERGSVETDYGKEAGRDLPQHDARPAVEMKRRELRIG